MKLKTPLTLSASTSLSTYIFSLQSHYNLRCFVAKIKGLITHYKLFQMKGKSPPSSSKGKYRYHLEEFSNTPYVVFWAESVKMRLLIAQYLYIVIANPRSPFVPIRSLYRVVINHSQPHLTDLVISQEASLSCVCPLGWVLPVVLRSTKTVIRSVFEGKCSTIGCQTESNLVWRHSYR